MDQIDREALERALQLTLEEDDQATVDQVRRMLRCSSWFEVASFCSYHCQRAALRLKPWDDPPCCADEDDPDPHTPEAVDLLKRMLANNISRFHPDPVRALEQAAERK
jgi:hypothetical protein